MPLQLLSCASDVPMKKPRLSGLTEGALPSRMLSDGGSDLQQHGPVQEPRGTGCIEQSQRGSRPKG